MPNTWADLARNTVARGGDAEESAFREELDGIARLAARALDAPIALITLKAASSQPYLGQAGLSADDACCYGSFCAYVMHHTGGVAVFDTRDDPRFCEHPMVVGTPHIRFFAGLALLRGNGAPVGSLCVFDTRPREALNADQLDSLPTLAKAARACIERWGALREHGQKQAATLRALNGMSRRFETLADALPQLVWSTPPNGLSDYFSRQWCEFTGALASDGYGTGWLDFLHPDDLQHARAAWTHAIATDSPYEIEYRLRNTDGSYRWMLARGVPVIDDDGAIARWVGTCTDIDERVRASEALEIMSQELSHRIKNLFSVVQGLIAMALRGHAGMAPVSQSLQSRMVALGRAHDLVRPRISGGAIWRSQTTLRQLIEILIAPYLQDEPARLEILGDDVAVNEQATTPLALFIHELATNSARFGALSIPSGRLRLTIALDDDLVVAWKESGGPRIPSPPQPAFGIGLARLCIERQLGGSLKLEWQDDGLHAEARIALRQLTAE